jgi:hypothetical protein
MQEEQIVNRSLRILDYRKTSRIWISVLCVLLGFATAHAKMTVVSLSELVRKSDVIVYGHVDLTVAASGESPSLMPFVPMEILKGKAIAGNGAITFCNPHSDELPDLSKMTGTFVIFGSKRPECFDLSHGDRSIISVEAGVAKTVAIRDQPETQQLNALLRKIRALVTHQAGTLN